MHAASTSASSTSPLRQLLRASKRAVGRLLFVALSAACGGSGKGSTATGTPDGNPAPVASVAFEVASSSDTQALAATAGQNPAFKELQTFFTENGFATAVTQASLTRRSGAVSGRTLSVRLDDPSSGTQVYLNYGIRDAAPGEPIVYAVNFTARPGRGFYVDPNGAIRSEGFDLTTGAPTALRAPGLPGVALGGELRSSRDTIGSPSSAECAYCQDACKAGLIAALADCGFKTVRTSVEITHEFESAASNEVQSVLQAVRGGWKSAKALNHTLREYYETCGADKVPDCSATGSSCAAMCGSCETGSQCGPGSFCLGGQCRTPCGATVCGTGEHCTGGASPVCAPITNTCPANWYYVGLFPTGGSNGGTIAGCCPNTLHLCGALTTGQFGGCCPAGTVCIPIGIGYGCCLPGLDKRC